MSRWRVLEGGGEGGGNDNASALGCSYATILPLLYLSPVADGCYLCTPLPNRRTEALRRERHAWLDWNANKRRYAKESLRVTCNHLDGFVFFTRALHFCIIESASFRAQSGNKKSDLVVGIRWIDMRRWPSVVGVEANISLCFPPYRSITTTTTNHPPQHPHQQHPQTAPQSAITNNHLTEDGIRYLQAYRGTEWARG